MSKSGSAGGQSGGARPGRTKRGGGGGGGGAATGPGPRMVKNATGGRQETMGKMTATPIGRIEPTSGRGGIPSEARARAAAASAKHPSRPPIPASARVASAADHSNFEKLMSGKKGSKTQAKAAAAAKRRSTKKQGKQNAKRNSSKKPAANQPRLF